MRHTDRYVRVWDERGMFLGGAPLQAGDDPARVARRILRDKLAPSDF
jgi:hypothetical protein